MLVGSNLQMSLDGGLELFYQLSTQKEVFQSIEIGLEVWLG